MVKNTAFAALLAALGITALIRLIPGGEQAPLGTAPQRLTEAQTLGLAYARYQHKVPFHRYRRANPKAKKHLYKLLADPDQEGYHETVWLIMGYLGDKADVNFSRNACTTIPVHRQASGVRPFAACSIASG